MSTQEADVQELAEALAQQLITEDVAQREPVEKIGPFARWGGSAKYATKIAGMMPDHRVYVEPFCGAASVFFAKDPAEKSYLCDKDAELVHALKMIKALDDSKLNALTKMDRTVSDAQWKALRSNIPSDPIGRLHRFLYLSGGSWSGVRRSSPNSPKVGKDAYNPSRLPRFSERLKNAEIVNIDYAEAIRRFDVVDAMFFIDPPYPGEWTSDADDIKNGTGSAGIDVSQMADLMKRMKGKWIAVLGDTKDQIDALKATGGRLFDLTTTEARSAAGGGPKQAKRYFAINYDTKVAKTDVQKKLSPADQTDIDREDAKIAENKKSPEAQRRHKFQPAKWTHPNGHPCCIICGASDRGGQCGPVAKAIKLAEVLGAAETTILRSGFVAITGDAENTGNIGVLLKGPMHADVRKAVESSVGRMMAAADPELAERLHFVEDELGAGAGHVELFDLALVRREDPRAMQVPVAKAADPMMDLVEPGRHKAVYQLHHQDGSIHGELRLDMGDSQVGWALAIQKAGAVPDVDTVEQAELLALDLDLRGNRIHKPLEAPGNVLAIAKASTEEAGVIVEVDHPEFELGVQKADIHEYFLTRGEWLNGAIYFRKMAGDGEWSAHMAREPLPSVLTKRAVSEGTMPPDGRSWLPMDIEAMVPGELRYWEKTGAEALAMRNELVDRQIFTKQSVKIVDGKFRRIVRKAFLDDSTPEELGEKFATVAKADRQATHPAVPFKLLSQVVKGQQSWSLAWHAPGDGLHVMKLASDPTAGDVIPARYQHTEGRGLMELDGDAGQLVVLDEEPGLWHLSLGGELRGTCVAKRADGDWLLELKQADEGVEILARVVAVEKSDAGFGYTCGVGPLPAGDHENWAAVAEYDGEQYAVIGKVSSENIASDLGKTLIVKAENICLDNTDGQSIALVLPMVVAETTRGPHSAADILPLLKSESRPDELADRPFGRELPILKSATSHYILSVVLEPNDGKNGAPFKPDTQSHVYSREDIRLAASLFFVKYRGIGDMHETRLGKDKIAAVDSWCTPVAFEIDGQHVLEGSWLVGADVYDKKIWGQIERGERVTWSVDGDAVHTPLKN